MIGSQVGGRYQLEARLGSGASSSVWRASDTATGRGVAIKILHVDASESPAAVARFAREARLLKRVSNRNVVALLACDNADPRPYLVFELVEGTDLREQLRQHGRLDPATALAVAAQIANGLGAAHAQRLVHRDLKPSNILIGDDGTVKVADFGIARALEEPGLTLPGRVVGTGDYLAPEQALGRDPDPRADLYSLGVVLFEMLTGRPPFRGAGFAEVAAKHLRQPPPPLDVDGLAPSVERLVHDLLAKDPDQRPRSATLVRDAARQALQSLPALDTSQPIVARALDRAADTEDAETGEFDTATDEPALTATSLNGDSDLAPWEDLAGSAVPEPGAERDIDRFHSAPYRVPASARRDSGSLRWVAVIALGVALAGAAAVLQLSGSGGKTATAAARQPPTTARRTTPQRPATPPLLTVLPISRALPYDPYADNVENNAQAPLAIDNNPATYWSTETYRADPDLTHSKGGVGLMLFLPVPATAKALILQTPAAGFTITVYSTSQTQPPATLQGWSRASATTLVAAPAIRIALHPPGPVSTILIWITKLAPISGQSGYAARISEVRILGPKLGA